jgi:hypothetical protein
VPYLFCTDEERGKLRTCYVYDHGADYMEQVLDKKRNYDEEYWFTNFARGRKYWDDYNVAGRYARDFMNLSDFFQNWYIGERNVLDDIVGDNTTLNDQVNETAIGATFNFLANVIATPEYGQFCRRVDNGQLYNLSTENEAREETSLFYRNALCGANPEYFYVRQGEGRRRTSRYDVNAGYNFTIYPIEASHNLVSIYAARALFDNEAEVISVSSGDYGTYVFGLYDYFQQEAIELVNSVYVENYRVHSPRLLTNGGTDTVDIAGYETVTGELVYPAVATSTFYVEGSDRGIAYDPLTGQSLNSFNALGATVPMFGVCSDESECVVDNKAVDAYCGTLYNSQKEDRCFPLYENVSDVKCPEGSSPEDLGGVYGCALPSSTTDVDAAFDQLAGISCSPSYPVGLCPTGYNCREGACHLVEPLVESSTSLTQKVYVPYFGMVLSGIVGMDSTLYDELHIYRVGSGETANPPEAYYDVVTFEDPFTGNKYAANKLNCNKVSDLPAAQRPAICRSANIRLINQNGAAELIESANRKHQLLNEYYDEFNKKYSALTNAQLNDESSPEYQDMLISNYKYYMAKNELEYAVRDINFLRSLYEYYSSLW